MIPLEPLHLGIASTLVVATLALLVNGIFFSASRPRFDQGPSDDEVAVEDVEFPQILKPGSPGPYVPRGFEALGLTADATSEEVLAAYRHLAIEAHPDRGGSVEEFTRLQENFELALAHAEGRLAHS